MSTHETDTDTESSSPQTLPENQYYVDPDKLTCDQAYHLVEQYFRQDVERSVTRVNHVLRAFDKPCTNHNKHRIHQVLEDRCEKHNPERSGPTRFKIPEQYR